MCIRDRNKDTKTPYSIKLTGSAPATGWDVYRTSVYEKCEKIPDAIQNGVISLAPRSITTLYMKTSMNHAPTIDKIVDKFIVKNGSGTANMTGITCGDPGAQVITITATSSDPSIVPNPVVTYTSPNSTGSLAITPVTDKTGEVTITVTVKDNGGTAKGGVDQTTITFKVTIPSGGGGSLDDVSDKAGVYPNPADDRISISVPSELEGARMIITNVSGQVVAEKIITAEDSTELNVGDLSGGTYMITISNDKSVAKLKFMKK